MKKKIWIIVSILSLLGGGTWYIKYLVTQKVYSEINKVIQSVDVDKEINKATKNLSEADISNTLKNVPVAAAETNSPTVGNNQGTSSGLTNQITTPGSNSAATSKEQQQSSATNNQKKGRTSTEVAAKTPEIKNRAEAIDYAMKKFSAQEIVHYSTLYKNKDSLSQTEKDKIKAEILSKFSAEEIKVLQVAANK